MIAISPTPSRTAAARRSLPSAQRRPEQMAVLGDEIIEVAFAAEAGGAGAGCLAQLLQAADVRNRGDDLVTREPLAVAEDVVGGLGVLHRSAVANNAVRHVAAATGTRHCTN